jgi:L-rhamnose-H+ transport protein
VLVLLSVFLIVSGLVIKYMSEKYRRINSSKRSDNLTAWWLLALFTGLTSGLQNITFVTVGFSSSIFLKNNDSFWVWPLFLSIGAIPMFFWFLYLSYDSKASSEIIEHKTNWLRNIISIVLMGILFTGSLFIYSYGMDSLTGKLQIVGWPTFMVGIIITTQMWGYLYREHNKRKISVAYEITSLFLLLASIIILSLVS